MSRWWESNDLLKRAVETRSNHFIMMTILIQFHCLLWLPPTHRCFFYFSIETPARKSNFELLFSVFLCGERALCSSSIKMWASNQANIHETLMYQLLGSCSMCFFFTFRHSCWNSWKLQLSCHCLSALSTAVLVSILQFLDSLFVRSSFQLANIWTNKFNSLWWRGIGMGRARGRLWIFHHQYFPLSEAGVSNEAHGVTEICL